MLAHMSVLYNSYYTINNTDIPLTDTCIHQRGFISGVSPNNQQYVRILKEIVHTLISKLIYIVKICSLKNNELTQYM